MDADSRMIERGKHTRYHIYWTSVVEHRIRDAWNTFEDGDASFEGLMWPVLINESSDLLEWALTYGIPAGSPLRSIIINVIVEKTLLDSTVEKILLDK